MSTEILRKINMLNKNAVNFGFEVYLSGELVHGAFALNISVDILVVADALYLRITVHI